MELADVRCLAVLGLRRSGRPAALLARRELPAARVVALDEGAAPEDDAVQVLEAAGVEVLTGAGGRAAPGRRPAGQEPRRARRQPRGAGGPAPRRPAVERGRVRRRFLPNRVIGITGTNGKTTTTELTGAIFRDAGLPVAVGGNVGYALAGMPGDGAGGRHRRRRALQLPARAHRALPPGRRRAAQPHRGPPRPPRRLPRATWTPSCASSRTRPRTTSRCCTPTTPGSSRSSPAGRLTGAAPARLVLREPGRTEGPGGRRRWWPASARRRALACACARSVRRLCRADQLALRGDHNLQNSLAAAAAACAAGVPVGRGGRDAAHLRRRAAPPAGRPASSDGVTYVNDSKATNVDATLKALTAYTGGVHLILGGYDKGAEYDELAAATEGRVREALLIGATAPQLEAAFAARAAAAGSRATPYVVCGDLAAAVTAAPRARPSRATSCCSARPARAGTSTGTTSSGANTSSSW